MHEHSTRTESDASGASKAPVYSTTSTTAFAAIKYAHQAEKLSYVAPAKDPDGSGTATQAQFITPQDPIIVTSDGSRLPGVPIAEAAKLNALKEEIGGEPPDVIEDASAVEKSENEPRLASPKNGSTMQKSGEGSLRRAMPPSRTNPLFPPLPLYGPSSLIRDLQCWMFRTTSFFL